MKSREKNLLREPDTNFLSWPMQRQSVFFKKSIIQILLVKIWIKVQWYRNIRSQLVSVLKKKSRKVSNNQKLFLFVDVCSLMKLFEGGILDKITNDEYEKMFQSESVDLEGNEKVSGEQEVKVDGKSDDRQSMNTKAKISSEKELTALNLRMLQGAFYLILMGYFLALVTLVLEIECRKAPRKFVKRFRKALCSLCRLTTLRTLQWFRDLNMYWIFDKFNMLAFNIKGLKALKTKKMWK